MIIFVVPSVLVRFVSPDDPHHGSVCARVAELLRAGNDLIYTPQAARESWSVLTRPKDKNGYGIEVTLAKKAMADFSRVFRLADDQPGIYVIWKELVEMGVSGKQVHDANHVAAMKAHGAGEVLTLDERDFRRYEWLKINNPSLKA